MLRYRALLGGWTGSSNRFSGDQKEVYTLLGEEESATSQKVGEKQKVTHSKIKWRRFVRIGQNPLKTICNNLPFIGHVLRIAGCGPMSIYSLEDGLLALVYQYLGLVDQVCLALSCKKAFSQYRVFAKNNSILLPQFTDYRLPLSFVTSGNKLRKQLLVRLENSRWAYCAECLFLKPRKLFTPDELKAPSLKRCCKRYDGIIELCSCLCLTRRDRKNIFGLLQSPITTPGFRYGCLGFKRDGEGLDGHLCPFRSNSGREVEVYPKISISTGGLLVLDVWYLMRLSSSDPFLAAVPVFACPHLDLIPLVHTIGDYTRCRRCFAGVWREPRSANSADSVTFHVFRPLGINRGSEQNQYDSANSHS